MKTQSCITAIDPPIEFKGVILLSWHSSAPNGTVYQVMVNHEVAWVGCGLSCAIPMPKEDIRVDVFALGDKSELTLDNIPVQ